MRKGPPISTFVLLLFGPTQIAFGAAIRSTYGPSTAAGLVGVCVAYACAWALFVRSFRSRRFQHTRFYSAFWSFFASFLAALAVLYGVALGSAGVEATTILLATLVGVVPATFVAFAGASLTEAVWRTADPDPEGLVPGSGGRDGAG